MSLKTRASQVAFQANERKSQILLCLGNLGMRGKSDFSLRHKVEDDFGSVAPRNIGVNDEFAFACRNQSLTDRSCDVIDMISRTVLLPFVYRVDEMEAIRVPGDRQHRIAVIDPSSCPCSGFIILWKALLLPIDLRIKR
jgi:hypothetical protein